MVNLTRKQKEFIDRISRLPTVKYPFIPVLLTQYKLDPTKQMENAIIASIKAIDDAAEEGAEGERKKLHNDTRARIREANKKEREKQTDNGKVLTSLTIKGTKARANFYSSNMLVNKNVYSWNIVLDKTYNEKRKLFSRVRTIVSYLERKVKLYNPRIQVLRYSIKFPYFSIYRGERKWLPFDNFHMTNMKEFKKRLEFLTRDGETGSDRLQEDGINPYVENLQMFSVKFFAIKGRNSVRHSCYTPDKYCIWYGDDNKIHNCGRIQELKKKGKTELTEINCAVDFLYKNFRCFARNFTSFEDEIACSDMTKLASNKDEDHFFSANQLVTIQEHVKEFYKKENACVCDEKDCKKTFSIVENRVKYTENSNIHITDIGKFTIYEEADDENKARYKLTEAGAREFFDPVVVSLCESDSEVCMILDNKLQHVFCFKGCYNELHTRKLRDDIYVGDDKNLYYLIEKKNKKKKKVVQKIIISNVRAQERVARDSTKYEDLAMIFGFDAESICDLETYNMVKPFLYSLAPVTYYEFIAFGVINIELGRAKKEGKKYIPFTEIEKLVDDIKRKYPHPMSSLSETKKKEIAKSNMSEEEKEAALNDGPYQRFKDKVITAIWKIGVVSHVTKGDIIMVTVESSIENAREYGLNLCKTFLSFDCTYEMMKHIYGDMSFNSMNQVGCLLGFNNASFDNFLVHGDLMRCKDRMSELIGEEMQTSTFVYAGQMLSLGITTNAQLYAHDVRKYLTTGSLASLCQAFNLVIFNKQKLEDDISHVEVQNKYNELGPEKFLKHMESKKEYIDYCKYDTLSTMLLYSVFTILMHKIDTTDILTNKIGSEKPESEIPKNQMENKVPKKNLFYKKVIKVAGELYSKDEEPSKEEIAKYNISHEQAIVINNLIANTFANKTIGSHAMASQTKYWSFTHFKPPTLDLKWYNLIQPGRVAGRVDKFAKSGRYDKNTNLLDNVFVKDSLLTFIARCSMANHAKEKINNLTNQLLHSFDMCGQYQYLLTICPVWYPGGENCITLEVLPRNELIEFKTQMKKKIKEAKEKAEKDGEEYIPIEESRSVANCSLEDLDNVKSEYYHICNESHILETRSVEDGNNSPTPDDYNDPAMKREMLGWFVCDVDQSMLRYKNLPYFSAMKAEGVNDFECDIVKDTVLTSVEISYMRSLGCVVKLKDGILFSQSRRSYEVFKPMMAFMSIKNEQDLIKDGKKKGIYNPAMREVGKLLPNSVSGKINEMIHLLKSQTMTISEFQLQDKLISKRNAEREDGEEQETISIIDSTLDGKLFVDVTSTVADKIKDQFAMGLGGFVYAYARIFMYEFVYKHIGLLASIYADTDACKGYSEAFKEWKEMAMNTTLPHWKETEEYDHRYVNHPMFDPNSKLFGGFDDELSKFNKGVKFDKGDEVATYVLQKKTWAYIHYDKDGNVLNAKMRAKGVSPSNAIIRLDEIPDLKFLKMNGEVLVLDIYNDDGSTNIEKYKQFSDYSNDKKNQLFYGAKSEDELFAMKDPRRYDNINYFFACAHESNTAYVVGSTFTRNVRNPCKNVKLGEYSKYFDKSGTLTLRCMLKKIVPRKDLPTLA